MTTQPATRDAIVIALSKLDTGTNDDAFTIPIQQMSALADLLEPEFRRLMALAWFVGCDQGIKWAQGKADRPLRNPYMDKETK
ncbi:hypothetical protein [Bifidobacterium callitrichos]|uniref:Uncharacterized protein n=1 Tax=Bifidobacterium callitrichos DSM 23973 TaxID=1437609 RepID=A0A087ACR2_9BIFI|nr:hypothetical protein [Bifidobacterium callitrichos]KFI56562.1 hypothetical protein BCAL_0157 [Bifidobacterium callitrichos DSM 23973]